MTDRSDERPLAGLLKRIVEECPHPARLIELYYWSGEHELADVMRQYIALAPEVRAALHAFLMLVKDEPGSVTVEIAANGEMTFSAPAAEELAKKMASPGQQPPFLH
jgi:nucleoid-associated protein YgaU